MTKKEFDSKLKDLNIDRKTFSELTETSYTTVTNWNDDNKPIPKWVTSWLNHYKKSILLDEIAKNITPYILKQSTK
jgi:hypothetical protein